MTREAILEAIRHATEPRAWSIAMWEGGSASFGRLDRWSDVDVGLAVEDGHVEDGFAAIEGALEAIAPIDVTWRVAPPGDVKPQRFYRLRGIDPYLVVDVVVFPRSTPTEHRYLDHPARHGRSRVLFDRGGFTAITPPSAEQWRERLRDRLPAIRERFEIGQVFSTKAALRGDLLEAQAFYLSFTMAPLIEALRMRHDPWRHDFGVRYLRHDLPEAVQRRLEELALVRDADDLLAKRTRAESWFRDEMATIDIDALPLSLE